MADIYALTGIDPWFLSQLQELVEGRRALSVNPDGGLRVTPA